jgi:hypothetical protein
MPAPTSSASPSYASPGTRASTPKERRARGRVRSALGISESPVEVDSFLVGQSTARMWAEHEAVVVVAVHEEHCWRPHRGHRKRLSAPARARCFARTRVAGMISITASLQHLSRPNAQQDRKLGAPGRKECRDWTEPNAARSPKRAFVPRCDCGAEPWCVQLEGATDRKSVARIEHVQCRLRLTPRRSVIDGIRSRVTPLRDDLRVGRR